MKTLNGPGVRRISPMNDTLCLLTDDGERGGIGRGTDGLYK